MLDILLLRKDLDTAIARLETRKNPQAFLDVSAFQALESERKTLQVGPEIGRLTAQLNRAVASDSDDEADFFEVQIAQLKEKPNAINREMQG